MSQRIRIRAHYSILENTLTKTVFIAHRSDEATQLRHPNHAHIIWCGELDVPVPDCAQLLRELYEEIKHGDDAHQQWLKEKIEVFIAQKYL